MNDVAGTLLAVGQSIVVPQVDRDGDVELLLATVSDVSLSDYAVLSYRLVDGKINTVRPWAVAVIAP